MEWNKNGQHTYTHTYSHSMERKVNWNLLIPHKGSCKINLSADIIDIVEQHDFLKEGFLFSFPIFSTS
jgi:hypothetical protein